MRVPDAITPLEGFREWHAWTDPQGEPVLMSVFHPSLWPHDRALHATCLKSALQVWMYGGTRDHLAPDETCQCGVYAHRTAGFLPCAKSAGATYVRGVVLGWGRYVLGTEGWRAEFARPVGLFASPGMEQWVAKAAGRYRCEVLELWPSARAA